MIRQEDARIYFWREILDVLKEGDLVEAEKEFPFIDNKKAVYNGYCFLNLRPKKIDAVEIIGRRNSNDRIITGIRYNLKDVSLIGRKIINPRDEFFEEFERELYNGPASSIGRISRNLILSRVCSYRREDEEYDRLYALLMEHGL